VSHALIVGVDMAKKDFAAASQVSEAVVEWGKFANEASGYGALAEQLKAQGAAQGLTLIHLIIEATGGYEAALVAYAYANQWLVSMPNPKQVRDWARGVGYRVKTDRVDAPILAHYGVERQPPVRPQLAVEVSELDSLLKRRCDLEQARQKEQTRHSKLTGRPGISPKVPESLQQMIEALTEALTEIQAAIDALCQNYDPFQKNMQRLALAPKSSCH